MSDAAASIEIEEDNLAASNVEEESERVSKKSKGKKRGKATKKKRSESIGEEDDDDEDRGSSGGKKKKGKKKAARRVSDTSEIQPEVVAASESVSGETPKETVVEIKDEKQADELEEIVVKKDEASVEGDNVIQEVGERSGEEKKDDKKDGEGEATKEVQPESEGGLRRRATLSDIRAESVDKGDEEQPSTEATGSEVNMY